MTDVPPQEPSHPVNACEKARDDGEARRTADDLKHSEQSDVVLKSGIDYEYIPEAQTEANPSQIEVQLSRTLQLEKENENLRARIEKLEEDHEKKKHEHSIAEAEHQKLRSQISESESTTKANLAQARGSLAAAREKTKLLTEKNVRLQEAQLKSKNELKQLNSEHEQLKSNWHNLHHDHGKLQSVKQHLEIQIQNLDKLTKGQLNQIRALTDDKKALGTRVSEQETFVTKAQQAAVSRLSQSVSTTLPDDLVRKRFRELFEELATWARENATTDNSILQQAEFVESLYDDYLLVRTDASDSKIDLNFDFSQDTAVDTLLNAALARRLCKFSLQNPFFFAGVTCPIITNPNTDSEQILRTDELLARVFNTMLDSKFKESIERLDADAVAVDEGNPAPVYEWRAATTKTLSSFSSKRGAILDMYREETDFLINHNSALLAPDLSPKEKQSLFETVTAFGDFAIQLWSHRYAIHFSTLECFKNTPFQVSSPELEAAQAMRLDDNDTSLDGRPIPLVVQPLIEGFGSPEGKDYAKRKVWSKAVVWVSSQAEPPAPPPPPPPSRKPWILF